MPILVGQEVIHERLDYILKAAYVLCSLVQDIFRQVDCKLPRQLIDVIVSNNHTFVWMCLDFLRVPCDSSNKDLISLILDFFLFVFRHSLRSFCLVLDIADSTIRLYFTYLQVQEVFDDFLDLTIYFMLCIFKHSQ